MSSVGTMVVSFSVLESDTLPSSFWMLSRPTPAKSCRIVVSGGQNERASSMSSKPTMLISPGMSRPSSCSACMAPRPIWSLAANIAVTSSRCPSVRPCRYPDSHVQSPRSAGGGVIPASSRVRCQDAAR